MIKEVMNALQIIYTAAKINDCWDDYNKALDAACNMFGTEVIAEELMKRKMV